MTDEPDTDLRERAWRALERSLTPGAPPQNEPTDPELLARIEAALLTLPRRRSAIFFTVCRDNASYAALAEQTGLSIKQVEREVAAALVQIDRALHEPPSRSLVAALVRLAAAPKFAPRRRRPARLCEPALRR